MVFRLQVGFPSSVERTVIPEPLSTVNAEKYLYRMMQVDQPSLIGQKGKMRGRSQLGTRRGVSQEAMSSKPL